MRTAHDALRRDCAESDKLVAGSTAALDRLIQARPAAAEWPHRIG